MCGRDKGILGAAAPEIRGGFTCGRGGVTMDWGSFTTGAFAVRDRREEAGFGATTLGCDRLAVFGGTIFGAGGA